MTLNSIFQKIYYKNEIIFSFDTEIIEDYMLQEILVDNNNKKIGIDMKNVKNIKSKLFIKYLLENKFKLFNLQNEVLVYLALILKSGFLKSHMNYKDFSQNKRELVKRRFQVA